MHADYIANPLYDNRPRQQIPTRHHSLLWCSSLCPRANGIWQKSPVNGLHRTPGVFLTP